MEDQFINVPQMLLIGSGGRNSGKTMLAAAVIRQWKDYFPIIGLKVTTVQERDGGCPRGGTGCGVCSNIKGIFEIIEETNQDANKDTALLLAAGAKKVYWLKVLKQHMVEGIQAFIAMVPGDAFIICESNSLRQHVKPGGFIMINNTAHVPIKASASEVVDKADLIIDYDLRNHTEKILEKIQIDKKQFTLSVRIKNDYREAKKDGF